MSRAFVSENDTDAAADTLPELPQSPHPNYVTRRGLRLLEERLAEAQAEQHRLQAGPDDPATELRLAHVHRDIRYLEARIERAIPVDAAQQPVDEVAFGAVVEVRDSKGTRHGELGLAAGARAHRLGGGRRRAVATPSRRSRAHDRGDQLPRAQEVNGRAGRYTRTIFPGFMMLSGSSAFFSVRMTATASPCSAMRKSILP
jgi:hypothetical protein